MKCFSIAVLLLLVTMAAFAQPSYPLVCRGGGAMHFNYTPFSNLSPQPQIWITFTRATAGVGGNWENLGVLAPGQCTWQDRAISPAEPNQIALLNVQQFAIQWQYGKVTGISSALPHISVLQDDGKYQAFNVYNNGKGYFIVTGIGKSQ